MQNKKTLLCLVVFVLPVLIILLMLINLSCPTIGEEGPFVLAEIQVWHGLESHSYTPYQSTDPDVIARQIQYAQVMEISGFIVNWYGPANGAANDDERDFMDQATSALFALAEENTFFVALLYDEGTIPGAEQETGNYQARAQSDIAYARQKYFSSSAYLTMNNKPALFIFPYDTVDQYLDWQAIRNELGTPITLIDKDPNPQDSIHDISFDGFYAWVQATDNNWNEEGTEWGLDYLNWFYATMQTEPYNDKITIGGVWPGFDDSLASWGENRYMARLGRETYDATRALAANNAVPYKLIATWNDFEEGTDIEFGVKMKVDMDKPEETDILIRSSPTYIDWNPDWGEAVLQVYKDGEMIYEQTHYPAVLLGFQSQTQYEIKIWVNGIPDPLSKWILVRRQDEIPGYTPIVVE